MNKIPGRCQCLSSCPNPSIKGEAFCSTHMNKCPRKAPLSGSEPKFEPKRWNDRKEIRVTHNCFSYAFNILDTKQIKACLKDPKCDIPFHQPGSASGYPRFNDEDPKTCPNLISRLKGDNIDGVTPSSFELKCNPGTSKIALVVDEDQDYHFLRQDSDGYFSQKSGGLPVTNKDAQGHRIFDVELANHDFARANRNTDLNYDRFCGYFCVPRDRPIYIKTGGYRKTKRSRRR